MDWLTRRIKNQKGVFLVFTAILIPIIFACAGLAMDLGNAFAHKSKLQNAADAAVLVYGRFDYGNSGQKPENAEVYMKANGAANRIDKVTERSLSGTSDTNNVLLSLYASEDVPTTFMRMFGFDTVPVSVVATCKVQKKTQSKGSGVFGYSFIGASTKKASELDYGAWPWDCPLGFYGSRQKIVGKVHSNGAIRLNGNLDGDGRINGTRTVLIDKKENFTTSITNDMELWASGGWINHYEHDYYAGLSNLYDNDICRDTPPTENSDWYHMARFGYDNGTSTGIDIVAPKPGDNSFVDVALKQNNDDTKAIYDYVEDLRKNHVIASDDLNQMKTDTYVKTDGNYNSTSTYPSWDGWGKYKIIVADGSVTINPGTIDWNADHVVIMSLHGDIQINTEDNKTLKALIYAPNGRIEYNGSKTFIGSMVAQRICLQKSDVTYTWSDFDFGGSTGSSGSGSSGSSGGNENSSIDKVTLHADQDSNYGNESTLWGS